MLIVDSHLDLSWNALQWNRDLRLSAHTLRNQERGPNLAKGVGLGTVALPEMRAGRVALSLATLLVRSTGRQAPHIDFLSIAQAYAIAQGQLAYYHELAREGACASWATPRRSTGTWPSGRPGMRRHLRMPLPLCHWASSSAWRAPTRSRLPTG